jgi:iron complex outermembrane receptor protein
MKLINSSLNGEHNMSIERSKLNRFLAGLVGAPVALGAFALSVGVASSASAEEALEEVVVTGSRAKPRTVEDSPIPVDVFSQAELEETGYTDANEVIKTLVPSFSIEREPISDGATFIRPASLRSLPADKTLVLVNSKRRHRAALVPIGGSGAQGPDMATIPMTAIKSIEVLRDGAGAIYGTDAIAGTINFILKDNSEGGSISVDTGEYTEGDGQNYTVRGNIGLPLGDSGFLSISGEHYKADATYRGEQYCQGWFAVPGCSGQNGNYATWVVDPDSNADRVAASQSESYLANYQNASLDGPVVQPWGRPNEERSGVFYNAGIPLANGSELYSFGNYTVSEADGSFYYRYPFNTVMQNLIDADGEIWNPLERYPGGFTPRFFGEVTDYSVVGGWRGDVSDAMSADLSVRYGSNEIDYTLRNTINPSMGDTLEQRDFHPGMLTNRELQVQADFSIELSDSATLAFGLSYMDEEYEITEGEFNSYAVGPYGERDPWEFCVENPVPSTDQTTNFTDRGEEVLATGSTINCNNYTRELIDPEQPELGEVDGINGLDVVYRTMDPGSNGFPGYSPLFAGVYSRDSYAVYGEINGDASDRFSYQVAARYEDYSDFDSEFIGKVAGIYEVSDVVAVRGSYGTGFRAPTPGQQGTTNVSTRLPDGFPVATALFPAGSEIAQLLGATPLKPEKSSQATIGLVLSGDQVSLTVDAYVINIDDRMYAVSDIAISNDPTKGEAFDLWTKIDNAGATFTASGDVFYFTNAFDTSSKGVDIVATADFDFSSSTGKLTAALNYNKQEVEGGFPDSFDAEDRHDFLNNIPNTRWVLTYNHYLGNLSLMGRLSYFGEASNSNGTDVQEYDAVTFLDLEASYQVTEQIKLMMGGRNVTDEYPDKDEIGNDCCGAVYPSATTIDWQGAYYYGRVSFEF